MALVGAQFVNAVSPNPVGSLQAYAGASAPSGWLLCDGGQTLITAYPELYSVLGTTYGALTNGSGGAGSTHFRVPDLRGRIPLGAGSGTQNGGSGSGVITGGTALTARTIGQFGGDERLATHNHGVTDPGHTHGHYEEFGNSNVNVGPGGNYSTHGGYGPYYGRNTTNTTGISIQNNANGGSGGNMPPFVVTNYIIKAVPDAPRSGLAYGTTPPIVTALPVNPQFGEVVTYAADATNGVYWDLQYDASGTYPWKFIGGGPLTASSTAGLSGTISNTGFVAGTPDLAVALPLSGDYWTTTTALATNNTAGAWWMLGLNGPGSAVVDQFCARVMQHANGNWFTNGAHSIKRTFTSSGTVQMQYRVTAGIATIAERGFSLTPIRVAA